MMALVLCPMLLMVTEYKVATPALSQGMWDAFSPRACDIHCKIST